MLHSLRGPSFPAGRKSVETAESGKRDHAVSAEKRAVGKSEMMEKRCVFYLRGRGRFCRALRAISSRGVSRKTKEYFETAFCKTDGYASCPIFREFYRALEKAELQMEHGSEHSPAL